MKRVLKYDGRAIIDIPDVRQQVLQFYGINDNWMMELIYCNGKNPYSFHRYGYTDTMFRKLWSREYTVKNHSIFKHEYPMLQYEVIKNETN